MARIRRPKKITGGEYTFGGGGGGASGDVVRFMRYSENAVENGGTGVLHEVGTKAVFKPIKIALEAGLSVGSADQTNSRVYWDHAFEAPSSVDAVLVTEAEELPSGVGSTVPQGLSLNNNADSTDTDTGYVYFSGTINSAVEVGTYKFRMRVSQNGWTVSYIDYEVEIWPAGTTPTFSSTVFTESTVVRNTAGKQYLTPTVTAPQAVAYSIAANSGFPAGVTPKIETDGRVYVENVGDVVVASQAHTVTIRVDLGQYGLVDQQITGSMAYGDPYGAIYWGPGNSKQGGWDGYDVSYNGPYMSDAQYDGLWNHSVTSGALRCRASGQNSTSPYRYGESIGLRYTEGWSSSSGNIGYLGPMCSSNFSTNSNGRVLRFKWVVPNGVTSFCVVAVGAGSMGAYSWSADGGGGGGMAWVNDVTCTPGEEFDIAIGLPKRTESSTSSYWSGSSWMRRINDAGYGANEFIVIGYGGGYQNGHASPLNGRSNPQSANLNHTEMYQFNNSRDAGSAAASTRYGTYNREYGGYASGRAGAGASGFSGRGGNSNNNNGSGGGAGAGDYYSSTYGTSAGGGVGLDGQGAGGHDSSGSGYGGTQGSWTTNYENDGSNSYRYGGGGGSGGSRGCYGENNQTSSGGIQNRYINGGMHGGGGGGSGTSWGGGSGGAGGLRIIWGAGRSFPYTLTTEDPTITDSRNPGDGR